MTKLKQAATQAATEANPRQRGIDFGAVLGLAGSVVTAILVNPQLAIDFVHKVASADDVAQIISYAILFASGLYFAITGRKK